MQHIALQFDRVFAHKIYQMKHPETGSRNRYISKAGRFLDSDQFDSIRQRFFPSFDNPEETSRLMALHPDVDISVITRRADAIIDNLFPVFGRENVSFGTPIRWHYDAFNDRTCPKRFWSTIDYLNFKEAGDHKVIWELNRHQYLLRLGEAYLATGNEKYPLAWMEQMDLWMDSNPPKEGINWASCLEIAYRSISWIWCLLLFKGSRTVTREFLERYTAFLLINGSHIEKNLSYYFSPNTHLTGEALGLFYLGLLFRHTGDGDRWLKKGTDILIEQLDKQILSDGVYFEQASYYHRYTADIYLHLYILMMRNALPIPPSLQDGLRLLLDFLMMSQKPDGHTPIFGDDDGGRLLFLNDDEYSDFRSCLSTGSVLFNRPDYKKLSGGFNQESGWLLGFEAEDTFRSLASAEPSQTSAAFPEGGYFIMRTGWDIDSSYLLVDCGPHGRGTCGHSHADLLSIYVNLGGKDLLIDPGTFTYTTSPGTRDYFRGSLAHNTVSIDNLSQSSPGGPFSWESVAIPLTSVWIPRKDFDFFSGKGSPYRFLQKPLTHRRDILFLKDRPLWIVFDRIESKEARNVSIRYHFPVDTATLIDNRFIVSNQTGLNGILSVFASHPMKMVLEDDWLSPGYSKRIPTKTGSCHLDDVATCSAITVIGAFPEEYEWESDFGDGSAFLTGKSESKKVTDSFMINENDGLRKGPGHIDSDFRWIWRNADHITGSENLTFISGSKIALDDIFSLFTSRQVEWLTVRREQNEISVELPPDIEYEFKLTDRAVSLLINGEKVN